MRKKQKDFYESFRNDMNDWLKSKGKNSKFSEYLMFAPDLFHLLCKLSFDDEVPAKEKAKLATAIAYFISPADLIPEALIGPAGYVDDIAIAAYVLNSIVNNTEPQVVKKHWVGEQDVLEVIRQILKVADKMIGSGLWDKIKKMVG